MQAINSEFSKDYAARSRTILLAEGDAASKKQELLIYFEETFSLYEQLFTLLNCDEAYYQTADPLRHPLIFYFGHTATFFINKLVLTKIIAERINPHFEALFAVGVDEMSWDDINKRDVIWPSVQEVRDYRNKVRAVVRQTILNLPLQLPIRWEDPSWIILMGIEHERIHLETSSVLIRQLPLQYVTPNQFWQSFPAGGVAPQNELIKVAGGEVVLGKPEQAATYGWDNEYGNATFVVKDFAASKYLVSNHEFLAFIADGGYEAQEWWGEEGWHWRQFVAATLPRFWRKRADSYYLRLLAEEIPMPWNWPVEVNYFESKAFCNWYTHKTQKNIRLPTEAEWHVLRQGIKTYYPQWEKAVGNIDLCYFASSCPVDYFKQSEFYDVIGNVWQWTETPINGFAGFKVHPAYDDFSIPTFDGKHNLMKGGSWISTGNEVIAESRYAFRRHFYQHAGFRYVESEEKPVVEKIGYESDRLLSEYLEFHFGRTYFAVANYPKVIADIAILAAQKSKLFGKALDLGCAVGRTAYELSKHFAEVAGVDFSARFINAAVQLQTQQKIKYALVAEGEICDYYECTLSAMGVSSQQADRIHFSQGDACNLHAHLTGFDLIVASNLIDRLYDPAMFLQQIHQRLNLQGILVISSPYTWLEEHTEKNRWLGGIKVNGENVTTLDKMKLILKEHFVLLQEPQDVPFVIRETQRKFQHSIAQVTVWQRIK